MNEGLQKSFLEDFENDIISFESCKHDSKTDDILIPICRQRLLDFHYGERLQGTGFA